MAAGSRRKGQSARHFARPGMRFFLCSQFSSEQPEAEADDGRRHRFHHFPLRFHNGRFHELLHPPAETADLGVGWNTRESDFRQDQDGGLSWATWLYWIEEIALRQGQANSDGVPAGRVFPSCQPRASFRVRRCGLVTSSDRVE